MTRSPLTERMIRVALLFERERRETQTDAQALYRVSKALGVTETAVAHCVRAVTQDKDF